MCLVLCSIGCDDPPVSADSGGSEAGCGAAALEVGTGDALFEPLVEGDPVTMVHGPQGGWHLLGSARARGTTPIVRLAFTVQTLPTDAHAGGVVVVDNEYNVQLVADEDDPCSGYFPGMYGYLDVTELADGDLDTPPELLAWQPLLMRMTLRDQDGLELTDEVTITAAPDPIDVP